MRYVRAGLAVAIASLSLGVMGCSYGGTTIAGDKAIVLQNSALFGLLRKAYVCKVTEAGLANCQSADSP
jgi:hypothetical protein